MSIRSDKIFHFLNKNVKYLRKKYDLTQPELAEKLKIKKSTLANFESGQKNISLELLVDISSALNANIHELILVDLEEQEKQKNDI